MTQPGGFGTPPGAGWQPPADDDPWRDADAATGTFGRIDEAELAGEVPPRDGTARRGPRRGQRTNRPTAAAGRVRAARRNAWSVGGAPRTIVLSAGAALAAITLGVTGYLLLGGRAQGRNPVSPTAPPTLPTVPANTPSASLGTWKHIASRAEDPVPLTLAELYPPRFIINGDSFVRTAERTDSDCGRAVIGTRLQAAVTSGHCSQTLRASYLSADGTMMGTIGVLNLSTANAAGKAGKVTGADDIIGPLDGPSGPTSRLSQGTGIAQSVVKGHYLILTWVGFADLKAPSTTAQRKQLQRFATDLFSGSANIALSNRMVTGKP